MHSTMPIYLSLCSDEARLPAGTGSGDHEASCVMGTGCSFRGREAAAVSNPEAENHGALPQLPHTL
jgi:hypothetical protein